MMRLLIESIDLTSQDVSKRSFDCLEYNDYEETIENGYQTVVFFMDPKEYNFKTQSGEMFVLKEIVTDSKEHKVTFNFAEMTTDNRLSIAYDAEKDILYSNFLEHNIEPDSKDFVFWLTDYLSFLNEDTHYFADYFLVEDSERNLLRIKKEISQRYRNIIKSVVEKNNELIFVLKQNKIWQFRIFPKDNEEIFSGKLIRISITNDRIKFVFRSSVDESLYYLVVTEDYIFDIFGNQFLKLTERDFRQELCDFIKDFTNIVFPWRNILTESINYSVHIKKENLKILGESIDYSVSGDDYNSSESEDNYYYGIIERLSDILPYSREVDDDIKLFRHCYYFDPDELPTKIYINNLLIDDCLKSISITYPEDYIIKRIDFYFANTHLRYNTDKDRIYSFTGNNHIIGSDEVCELCVDVIKIINPNTRYKAKDIHVKKDILQRLEESVNYSISNNNYGPEITKGQYYNSIIERISEILPYSHYSYDESFEMGYFFYFDEDELPSKVLKRNKSENSYLKYIYIGYPDDDYKINEIIFRMNNDEQIFYNAPGDRFSNSDGNNHIIGNYELCQLFIDVVRIITPDTRCRAKDIYYPDPEDTLKEYREKILEFFGTSVKETSSSKFYFGAKIDNGMKYKIDDWEEFKLVKVSVRTNKYPVICLNFDDGFVSKRQFQFTDGGWYEALSIIPLKQRIIDKRLSMLLANFTKLIDPESQAVDFNYWFNNKKSD